MFNPEVSVIVLTYNQETKISRALDSILAQKCNFRYEIIIGDDASSDSTRAICEEYVARYPNVVRLMPKAPNKGIVDNYFDCFLSCRGRYVADCAGDDYWLDSNRLQRQRDYLKAYNEVVVVMSDWIISSPQRREHSHDIEAYKPFQKYLKGEQAIELLLGCIKGFPLLSAMMYKHQALAAAYRHNATVIRRKEWMCEDFPLLVSLAAMGNFGYLPLDALVYEVGDESVSNSSSFGKQFDFYLGPAKSLVKLTDYYGIDPKRIKPAFDARIKYLASMAWKAPTSSRIKALTELSKEWSVSIPLKAKLRLTAMRLFRH